MVEALGMGQAVSFGIWLLAVVILAGTVRGDDWPQAQKDAQRTGWTSEEVAPPYRLRWVWFGGDSAVTGREDFPRERTEGFADCVQPVVAGGVVYIGAVSGRIYAIDARSGKTLWQQQTRLPIMHTCAVAAGVVIVPGMDKCVHGFDARTGQPRWRFEAPAGFSTGILIADELAIAACRNGTVYALDPASGSLRWQADLGAPIYNTPAAGDGLVFVASEDMVAHGLSLADGKHVWRASLEGQSARHYWPVVSQGVVLFRTMCPFHSDEVFEEFDRILRSRSKGWADEREGLLEFLTKNPSRQSLFAFDTRSGRQLYIPPMGLVTPSNDTPRPAAVSPSGKAYLTWRARPGRWRGGTFAAAFTPQIDPMDLRTGDRIPEALKVVSSQSIEADNDFLFSGSGNYLFAKNSFRGSFWMDIRTGEVGGILRNVSDGYPLAANAIVLYGRPGSGIPGPGGGAGESPVVAADGCLFLAAGPLIAIEPDPTRRPASGGN